jgi:hypothetical protein
MSKETLEEVAERILANNIDGLRDALKDDDLFFFYKGVIKCYGEAMAEWQQERMYEDMKEAFKANYTPFSATNIGDVEQDFQKWFEQHKKK